MNRFISQFKLAVTDLLGSLVHYRLWLYMGWLDIQQRYRGSILGPLWITLSMVIFITVLSVVYSRLFHTEIQILLPYLTAGMLVWVFVSTILLESSDIFITVKPLIENIKLPYLSHILRLVWRNLIIFFHNLLVFVGVALIFKINLGWGVLMFFPALLLTLIVLASIAIAIALLGTRFRDLPPLISSFIMVVFFVSPITWKADMLGQGSWIIRLNPVAYFLDLLRSPLLGQSPMPESWIICGLLTCLAFACSFLLFVRFRSRIPFWI